MNYCVFKRKRKKKGREKKGERKRKMRVTMDIPEMDSILYFKNIMMEINGKGKPYKK